MTAVTTAWHSAELNPLSDETLARQYSREHGDDIPEVRD